MKIDNVLLQVRLLLGPDVRSTSSLARWAELAFPLLSCAMERETVLMEMMRVDVVGLYSNA